MERDSGRTTRWLRILRRAGGAMPGFQMEARVSIEGFEVWQHMGAENIGFGRRWSAHTQVPGAWEGGGVGIPHLRH